MPATLLKTKLYIPLRRPNLVPRPRLIQRLDAGLRQGQRLVLVSAPAGYGKTTLIVDWLSGVGQPFAWLSLDEADNDLARFLTHVIAGLQQVNPRIGQSASDLLALPSAPPAEALVTSLINDMADLPTTLIMVLDDYQVLRTPPIHASVQFLLDHQPVQLVLIVITREDPPLLLPRLRVQGQIVEIRADDLRFSTQEAAEFFRQTMRLDLSANAVTMLTARTEGWVASLQLAGLALQGEPGRDVQDVDRFVAGFGGRHRYLNDYLVEQVLEKQPTDVRDFMCETAILDRLTGPLCEVVTGRADAQATLEKLERDNLFLVPLDQEQRWYRYHRLFAELLRYRLQKMQPDRLAELHRRAAMWYEQNGLAAEAIEHWLTAPDHEQAARIVEENAETMHWGQGEPALVRYWLEHLPHEVVLARPRLCLAYVWALATTGLSDKVEPYLRAAQDRLREGAPSTGADAGTSSSTAPVPGAEAALGRASRSRLLGEVAGIRASLAWHRGDLADAIQQYQRALAQLPEDDPHLRSRVMMGLAEAYFLTGDARSASQAYQTINDLGQKSHSLLASLAAMARLWHLQVLQGRLRQAAATCSEMQQLVEAQAELPPAVAGVPAVAGIIDACQGDLLREWNELEKAEQRLRRGVERGQRSGNPLILLNSYVGLARVLQARGETDAALQAISSALQVERQYHVTWTRGGPPVSTYGAHLALMQDHLAAAVQWADEQHLQITDDIPYPRELDYLTLARVLLAQGRAGEAMGLLKRLQLAAESSGRFGRALEAQMLRALAYRAQDNISQALEALSQALAQAQPEGYVRLFVDEGEPMRLLILDFRLKIEKQARSVSDEPARRLLGYADTLLTSFDRPSPTVVQRQSAIVGCKHPRNQQSTIEALSEREMEVLRLMAAGKSNQEIARTLVITVGTVKTHNNHIFSKLGVQNRAQAIVRAQALGLI